MEIFDVAVVGLGGHGSATVAHLARRGAKVSIYTLLYVYTYMQ